MSDATKPPGTNVIDLALRRPTLPISDVEVARDFLSDMLLEIHAAADEPLEVRQRAAQALEVLEQMDGSAS